MKMKYKLRLSMIAACLVVCLLVVAYAASMGDRTDTTSASAPEDGGAIIGGSNERTNIFVTVSPTLTPKNAAWPGDETKEKTVYMTEFGTWYHDDPVCQGLQGATPVPLSEAIEEHKLPCPVCIGKTVYATANGKFYHSDPGCSGMTGAGQWTESDAVANGKLPCPVCMGEAAPDPASWSQKAMDALEAVFPGCIQVFKEHYNTDQFYTSLPVNEDRFVTLNLYAGDVRVAQAAFDGEEARLSFRFIDVELRSKLFAGAQEGTLSDKLTELYLRCKEELLGDLLSAVHSSAKSLMPISAEPYNLQSMELVLEQEECMSVTYVFQTRNSCGASFTFDVVEGDALREVSLQAY